MDSRISKKELKEDIMISFLQRAVKYARENVTKIQTYGGIGIGVIILTVFLLNTIKGSSRDAQVKFSQAQNLYLSSSPLQKDGYQQAKKSFQELQEKHSLSQWAKSALFYEGMCNYQLKEYKQAIDCFNRFITKNPKHLLAPLAQEKIADIYQQQQEFSQAIGAYERLVKSFPEGFNSSYAYLSIGRCYEQLKDKTRAKEAYKKVLAGSAWIDEAKFYLKRLED